MWYSNTKLGIVVVGAILMVNPESGNSRIIDNSHQAKFDEIAIIRLPSSSPLMAKSSPGPQLVDQMKAFKLATEMRPRPVVSWKDAKGDKVTLEDFDGKVVLLNFWASWCPPCLRELPSINTLQASLGSDKFTVIALNIDQGGKPIASRFKRRLKLDKLDLHLDKNNGVARLLKIKVLPTTIIFDAKGREVGRMEAAAEWDSKEAYSLIQYFIKNPNHTDKLQKKIVTKGAPLSQKAIALNR